MGPSGTSNGRSPTASCICCSAGGHTDRRREAQSPAAQEAPFEELKQVTLFAECREQDLEQLWSLFKERRFAPGETVTKEGSGGAAFFLIKSGEASVTVRGSSRPSLGPGDYFGEIALIDGGERAATVTAVGELICHGLTYWDFRPLVQSNAASHGRCCSRWRRCCAPSRSSPSPAGRASPGVEINGARLSGRW